MISETYYDAFTSWRYDAAADHWEEAAKVTSRGLYDSAFGYQVITGVTQKVSDPGWVGLDLRCSTILLGQ